MKILDNFTLKIIAIISMVLDHILTYMGGTGAIEVPIWFGYLGKIAAPIFFFLIVEGFFHTRSKSKYLARLLGFGILMIGVDVAIGIHNNIFLSLALSVTMMMMLDNIKNKNNTVLSVIGFIACLVGAIFTEASVYGIEMTLIFYLLRDKKAVMWPVYALVMLLPTFSSIGTEGMYDQLFLYDYQWMAVLALPFIMMYNGKLGLKNTFTKWMFYAFYPAHLIIIVLLGRAL